MERFVIEGGNRLIGEIKVSGAKNVAMKAVLVGLLTQEPIVIKNIPLISSVTGTINIVKPLGIEVSLNKDHTMKINGHSLKNYQVPLEVGGLYRSGPMVLGPLLARFGRAVVPNPGGCRIGRRPIDRHIEGLRAMGAKIDEKDGFYYASCRNLQGIRFKFNLNTHTGTETLILAAVLARGETILENAAEEPEVDDLISLLNLMGGKIKRKGRTIFIKGVKKLHGTEFTIMPDRNEAVTFAIAAIASRGDVVVEGTQRQYLNVFLEKLKEAGGDFEAVSDTKTRFFYNSALKATNITTAPYPGFMTDWQAPWALLMNMAKGESKIHETIYEDRFGYVSQLQKMGSVIDFFNPRISDPTRVYNFNWSDREYDAYHAIRITGPQKLHNAILEVADLRAGATLLIASLVTMGESSITGIEHIDRGYEKIEERFKKLGAKINRVKE